jgi:pimeloyl-ACP methyl ester carboxylesterase
MTSISHEDLVHRASGEGAPLLLIHGSGGDLDTYAAIETELATCYRVITYQRRTDFLRTLTIDDHVRDALSVLRTCADRPAYIFGSSAGAVIGLSLLSSYPEMVSGLLAHEPPLVQVLDERIELLRRFDCVLQIERARGTEEACAAFFDLTGILGSAAEPVVRQIARAVAARSVPPIREIHPILDYVPDLLELRAQRHKLALCIGSSNFPSMPMEATIKLAQLTEVTTCILPGNHFGYMAFMNENDPSRFQKAMLDTLAGFAQSGL